MNRKIDKAKSKHYDENGKCIHDGHRQRLLQTAYEAHLEGLSDVQIVEVMLFFIFPRGDVNPLAHRLLDHFGTFTATIDASLEELAAVEGMGISSARKLKVFADLFYQYTEDRMAKKVMLDSFVEIVDCVEQALRFRNTEHVFLLALSPAHVLIRRSLFSLEESGQVSISAMEFANFLTSTHPAAVVLAHNHPYGRANPSGQDAETFERLKHLAESYAVNFVDSYIVGEDGIYSQREDKFVRKYHDIGDLTTKFKVLAGVQNQAVDGK